MVGADRLLVTRQAAVTGQHITPVFGVMLVDKSRAQAMMSWACLVVITSGDVTGPCLFLG